MDAPAPGLCTATSCAASADFPTCCQDTATREHDCFRKDLRCCAHGPNACPAATPVCCAWDVPLSSSSSEGRNATEKVLGCCTWCCGKRPGKCDSNCLECRGLGASACARVDCKWCPGASVCVRPEDTCPSHPNYLPIAIAAGVVFLVFLLVACVVSVLVHRGRSHRRRQMLRRRRGRPLVTEEEEETFDDETETDATTATEAPTSTQEDHTDSNCEWEHKIREAQRREQKMQQERAPSPDSTSSGADETTALIAIPFASGRAFALAAAAQRSRVGTATGTVGARRIHARHHHSQQEPGPPELPPSPFTRAPLRSGAGAIAAASSTTETDATREVMRPRSPAGTEGPPRFRGNWKPRHKKKPLLSINISAAEFAEMQAAAAAEPTATEEAPAEEKLADDRPDPEEVTTPETKDDDEEEEGGEDEEATAAAEEDDGYEEEEEEEDEGFEGEDEGEEEEEEEAADVAEKEEEESKKPPVIVANAVLVSKLGHRHFAEMHHSPPKQARQQRSRIVEEPPPEIPVQDASRRFPPRTQKKGVAAPKSEPPAEQAEDEDGTPEKTLCVICLKEPADMLIYPCGHRCICEKDAKLLCTNAIRRCPVCRNHIRDIIRIFE